jgi:hypothetical protein
LAHSSRLRARSDGTVNFEGTVPGTGITAKLPSRPARRLRISTLQPLPTRALQRSLADLEPLDAGRNARGATDAADRHLKQTSVAAAPAFSMAEWPFPGIAVNGLNDSPGRPRTYGRWSDVADSGPRRRRLLTNQVHAEPFANLRFSPPPAQIRHIELSGIPNLAPRGPISTGRQPALLPCGPCILSTTAHKRSH